MHLSDFYYELPRELVARKPLPRRSSSKLMLVRKETGRWAHKSFQNLFHFLEPGDCLVLNRSKVIPARLFVRRKTGGKIEVLFVRNEKERTFRALLKPASKLRAGEELTSEDGGIHLRLLRKLNTRETELELLTEDSIMDALEKYGHVPLPPYIDRPDEVEDRSRYQTVYAREKGSVAAPTAGLHFDRNILESIRKKGIKILTVLLHVGPGTFLPLEDERVEKNKLLSERFEVSGRVLKEILRVKEKGGRVVAVGTTATRVLESSFAMGLFERLFADKVYDGETDLFIYPGFRFNVIDGLLTNFHLPASSLLLLVCAFLGREKTLASYQAAVEKSYRFYSYGDAMLII